MPKKDDFLYNRSDYGADLIKTFLVIVRTMSRSKRQKTIDKFDKIEILQNKNKQYRSFVDQANEYILSKHIGGVNEISAQELFEEMLAGFDYETMKPKNFDYQTANFNKLYSDQNSLESDIFNINQNILKAHYKGANNLIRKEYLKLLNNLKAPEDLSELLINQLVDLLGHIRKGTYRPKQIIDNRPQNAQILHELLTENKAVSSIDKVISMEELKSKLVFDKGGYMDKKGLFNTNGFVEKVIKPAVQYYFDKYSKITMEKSYGSTNKKTITGFKFKSLGVIKLEIPKDMEKIRNIMDILKNDEYFGFEYKIKFNDKIYNLNQIGYKKVMEIYN